MIRLFRIVRTGLDWCRLHALDHVVLGVSAYLNSFIARCLSEFVPNTLFAWSRIIKPFPKKQATQGRYLPLYGAKQRDGRVAQKVSSYCMIFVINEISSIRVCVNS